MTTWVESINGYTGSPPFQPDPGIMLDANDIHVTGGTGETIKAKASSIANGIQMLEVQPIGETGKYKIRIGNYPLVMN